MIKPISRREFVAKGARLGLSAALGGALLSTRPAQGSTSLSSTPDIVAVAGPVPFQNAMKAVEMLGGPGRFVPRGARVALLPNVQSRHPGTFTKPEVLRAVIRLCREAGAAEVNCLSWLTQKHWDDTGLSAVVAEEKAGLMLIPADEAEFRTILIPRGKSLSEARVIKAFYDHDVFLNLPITKDHAGNRFTGTLKNMMGLNYRVSNRTFHRENWKTDPADILHLDQCIADLNTVITPALNLVDATEFIITNGPMGPGELHRPRKVVAGTDRVAVDAYCAALWGLKAGEIHTIRLAEEHGLGVMDLAKLKIQEAVLPE